MSRLKIIAPVGLVALLLIVVGLFFPVPRPHVALPAEPVFHLGNNWPIYNTFLSAWLSIVVLGALFYGGTRRMRLIPSGLQNFAETVIELLLNFVEGVAGRKNGRRFFPVVATIFIFVLVSNWLSLLPIFNAIGFSEEKEHGFVMEQASVGFDLTYVPLSSLGNLSGDTIEEDDPNAHEKYAAAKEDGKFVGELLPLLRGPNTDLNTPLALAIASAIAVETWGVTSLGFFTYGRKFFNFGGIFRGLLRLNFGMMFQGMIDAFVGILEFISELVRLVSFTFRLFGNMFAGEVVILMFTFLTPLVLTIAFYGLELFVGIIQAFIFAMLTLVFGIMAVTHGEHAAHEAEESHAGAAERLQESEA